MTESRQARARRARQQQRLAEQYAEQVERRRRRRLVGTIVGTAVALVLIVATVVFFATTEDDPSSTTTPSDPERIECVGLKDTLPEGAPKVDIPAGPAPLDLVTKDLIEGNGAEANQKPGEIEVHYLGVACRTGKIFDSSWQRQATLKAELGSLIPGWQRGIPGMREGGRRLLRIPSELAYGQSGGPGIPPNEPLIFVIDLKKA